MENMKYTQSQVSVTKLIYFLLNNKIQNKLDWLMCLDQAEI